MIHEIKRWDSHAVLWSGEAESLRDAAEKAVAAKISLDGANLNEADLYGADLYGADLSRANLYGANLRGADLSRADLNGADLRGANLRGARLNGAKYGDETLTGVISMTGLRWPIVIFWCDDSIMQIGCQVHAASEWAEFDDETIEEMDKDALDFWRVWKAPLLALCAAK